MTASELTGWQAYSRLWPIGPRRMDLLFANLYALISRALGGKRAPRDLRLYDPFPVRTPATARSKQKLLKAQLLALTRALGGKVEKHGDR